MKAAKSLQTGAALAYVAAAINLLLIEAVFFGGTTVPFVLFVLNFSLQFMYLFIINSLPCPSWARACGYSACILQIILFIAILNYLPMRTAESFFSGLIVIKALWIVGSSWEMKRLTKIVGLLLASFLALEVLFSGATQHLRIPQSILILALYALWFLLIGRVLTSKTENLPRLLSFPNS